MTLEGRLKDEEIYQAADDEKQQDWDRLEYEDIYKQGFIDGAKWARSKSSPIIQQEIADAKPKWISVKDRLPELGVNVLCYSVAKDIDDGDNDNIITMGKRFINYTQQPVFVADAGMFYEIEKILFWMPLPESPKESE